VTGVGKRGGEHLPREMLLAIWGRKPTTILTYWQVPKKLVCEVPREGEHSCGGRTWGKDWRETGGVFFALGGKKTKGRGSRKGIHLKKNPEGISYRA